MDTTRAPFASHPPRLSALRSTLLLPLLLCTAALAGCQARLSGAPEDLARESLGGGPPALDDEPGEDLPPSSHFLPCEVATIIEQRCVKCHGGGLDNPPLLRTYDEVSENGDAILASVADDTMPYVGAPLTAAQKAILQAWVDGGAAPLVSDAPPDCAPQG